jgi:hypothetical protein
MAIPFDRVADLAMQAAYIAEHGVTLIPPADRDERAVESWLAEQRDKRHGDGMRRTIDPALAAKRMRRAKGG